MPHCLPATWRASFCLHKWAAAIDSIPSIAEIFGIFLPAGLVKGLIGLGLPTVAIGLLGLMMAPAQAAALLIVPSLVTNIWQAVVGPALLVLLRRLWPMFAGICLGTCSGAGIITGSDSAVANAGLGVALIVYAVLGLSKVHVSVPPRAEIWLAPLVSVTTGIVSGATGILTLPAVVYLQAIGLRKDELVQALGMSFTISTVALGAALMDSGVFRVTEIELPLIALLAALIGTGLGRVLRTRTRPESFQHFFFIGLLLLGGHLALRVFL